MRVLEFTVPAEWDGVPAKRFLRGCCHMSHRLMVQQKHLPSGITMDGLLLRTIDKVQAGSVVRVVLPDDPKVVEPVNVPLQVVYEDEDMLVLDKPFHMPVHPSRGHEKDTLANAVTAYLKNDGQTAAFRALNRLDRDTSGLVVCCKNAHVAARLTRQVDKRYFALIQGELSGSGTIDAPLRHKEGHGIQREVGDGGERAVTHWSAVESHSGHTLLCIRLETGRTHQIRTHFSYLGYPLVGDSMYGGSHKDMERQALHCGWAAFIHPITGERIQLFCPFPEDMQMFLKRLGFSFSFTRLEAEEWAKETAADAHT